ncbi:MAG TPA: pyridoxal phosphate-dependent aminotransferase [Spirochaetia bacterium]|mgnify:CR=1 FL=1|nr:pyridoxal phosphate-dependent aminotransferase [Spirochaetales bacterium]HPD80060.1 pyridoxal phosphate-dependent aminotransferase [Spirochaetales bacterium]HQK33683.1 pyridoxal phosphate-dependent aminotransferase [Spirochaetales bacterium]HRS65957.1 pyridoxal phosphate-dependent aminotransferase [Spirochaetia bacterium]HRV28468.1 pyridoxal phosphate-dependent aminotransferase [Spirochaetia bacterium]
MPVARAILDNLERSSWIRRMFEEGLKLKQQFGAENVFDFSLGNPDVEPPEEFKTALKEAVASSTPGKHAYMPNAGHNFARSEMAQKISLEHGVTLTEQDVVLTVGAAGALNVILKTIINPQDEVMVLAPYFAEYFFYVNNHRGTLRVVETDADFLPDVSAMKRALNDKTAAVLINTPNNPSGRVYPEHIIHAIADMLNEFGQQTGRYPYLIVDEPYRDIVYDGITVPPVLNSYRESIVVSSFSKTLSIPGERFGYIGVNPAISDKKLLVEGFAMANRILGFVNAPALMQYAVSKSWRSRPDIDRYRKRRDMLVQAMQEAGLSYAKPEGAFYLFCKVPESAHCKDGESADITFSLFLKDHNILAVPGTGFGYPGYVRFSYCVPERVIEGVSPVLKQAVEEWTR